jgi:hypothetical protein
MFAEKGFTDFRDSLIEIIGAEDTYGGNARDLHTREVMVRIALRHEDPVALTAFVREFPSIGLGGPCGIGGGGSGLPKPSPVLRLEAFLVPRDLISVQVALDDEPLDASQWVDVPVSLCRALAEPRGTDAPIPTEAATPTVELPLVAIAFGRSGDKGDSVNIGIAARHPDFEPIIHAQVTAPRVAAYLAHFGATRVQRFALPGGNAVNFMLHQGLGGGGTASLRIDPQGKAAAQQLLDIPVRVPVTLLSHPAIATVVEVREARSRQ